MFTTPLSANSTGSAVSEGKLRYGLPLRVLHWLTALCMFIIIPLAWYMTELDRHNPAREGWFNLHKSIGLTVLLLTLIRLFTRLSGTPTPLPGSIPPFERVLAHIGHGLLYVILIAMPVTGYLNSYGAGHPVNWFWLFRVPAIVPENHWLGHLGGQIHALLAWATYVLIVGHMLAVFYHQVIQRIDILARMTIGAGKN